MSFWRSRRSLLVVAGILVLIFLLWRPGADRLRSRLERSLSSALGHTVEIGNVSLQILPQPGFHLTNFSVRDDPEFSAEPILRAEEVSATLHPGSLWRWRIEIATLSFKDASLNLVRRSDGRWNVAPLLERAAHAPAAPTGSKHSESRPRVPYIELSNGRVNLKLGAEKTPYALIDADLALWLASDEEWGIRLKGQPVRTDMRLSDTGIVRANGTWRRAADLRKTPLRLSASYEGAQLGQLTKLIYGADKGWRGTVAVSANVTGSAEDLRIQSDGAVDNFRRYDIVAGRSLRLNANCAARYTSSPRQLSEILCTSPAGQGSLQLRGAFTLLNPPTYDLSLNAKELPVQQLTDVFRRVKKGLPEDLTAAGSVNAELSFRKDTDGSAKWSGGGAATSFVLRSAALQNKVGGDSLDLGRVPFLAFSGTTDLHPLPAKNRHGRNQQATDAVLPPGSSLEIGPLTVDLGDVDSSVAEAAAVEPSKNVGKEQQAIFRASFSSAGYAAFFSGEGSVERLLQMARAAGATAIQPDIQGEAKFDWQARGSWGGFAPPQTSGTIQLRKSKAKFPGLNAPVEIAAADITLTPDTLTLGNLSATSGGIHWTGSLARPRLCPGPEVCFTKINLRADEISTREINLLLNPNIGKQPWYRNLTGGGPTTSSILRKLSVQGLLKVDRFVVGDLVAETITTELKLEDGHLHVTNLRGSILGGRHTGDWHADFTQAAPNYTVAGTFDRVSFLQLSKLMHNSWITGTARGSYELNLNGWSTPELQGSSHGSVIFDAHNGALARFGPASSALKFKRLQGTLTTGKSLLVVSKSKLTSTQGVYGVSGVASLGRNLDFKFLRDGSHGFAVTGTLDAPRVETLTTPQASTD